MAGDLLQNTWLLEILVQDFSEIWSSRDNEFDDMVFMNVMQGTLVEIHTHFGDI